MHTVLVGKHGEEITQKIRGIDGKIIEWILWK
jgi:hypothetical protein